jgi:hypothetical protein
LDVGDRYEIVYLAYNDAKALTDATVALTVTDPTGAVTNPSMTHASTGTYTYDLTLTTAGVWTYKIVATGTVVEAITAQVTAKDPAPPTYSTLPLLKQALGISATDATRDDLLNLALAGASRAIEQYCEGRRFYLDQTASARTYPLDHRTVVETRRGYRVLVDDFGDTTGLIVEVKCDSSAWTTLTLSTDFETYPDNALAQNMALTGIFTRRFAQSPLYWNTDIRVTARWGWPQVPTQVEHAALLQATRLYKRKDSPEGVSGSADWGLIRVPNLDPDVQRLLAFLTTPMKVA